MILEEKILSLGNVHPLRMVGWEGFWGLLVVTTMLTIFQQVECEAALCSNGKVEDSVLAIRQIMSSFPILLISVLISLSLGLANAFGVSVTKFGSASQRVTIAQGKIMMIWIFFLIYPGEGHETFSFL